MRVRRRKEDEQVGPWWDSPENNNSLITFCCTNNHDFDVPKHSHNVDLGGNITPAIKCPECSFELKIQLKNFIPAALHSLKEKRPKKPKN